MWKAYCSKNDGLAVVSTERQLQHQFTKMRIGREVLFFRDISYVDHATHIPSSSGIPEQAFFKTKKFIDEREIRFAWWLPETLCGSQADIETQLIALSESKRLPFDLNAATESIVFNPMSSKEEHASLQELMTQCHPSLVACVKRSAF